jgi:hypothetical protein
MAPEDISRARGGASNDRNYRSDGPGGSGSTSDRESDPAPSREVDQPDNGATDEVRSERNEPAGPSGGGKRPS